MKSYFVTGIDTDSGKTLVAAILCEALSADYWKPIQAGLPKDSDRIKELISNSQTKIHSEKFLLKTPASPHAAAKIDNIEINITDFELPNTKNNLVVEGAGGCLVPINDKDFVIDIIKKLNIEVILVADLYLGSINHTLLTTEALHNRSIPIKGIIFNGESNEHSEKIILHHSKLNLLGRIEKEKTIDKGLVSKYASVLRSKLNEPT
jgi:dethiobiotin synthetase